MVLTRAGRTALHENTPVVLPPVYDLESDFSGAGYGHLVCVKAVPLKQNASLDIQRRHYVHSSQTVDN
jgi:hypothetical protein